eukprot:CAMPEP_0204354054 /NCGR_PEP_ID=MMETSP0469-20131031/33120_1 /ASSEMBLY_ACC=CAM_ASM_000384 /TAXON_ID=2969 /ORGANISM="Oxyrrhis marina" /LENGTH=229 /DNA_ID=CAMNT_0051341071 /DNA_START=12 /DNA_END=701 /DNA_ORIENTATION=-
MTSVQMSEAQVTRAETPGYALLVPYLHSPTGGLEVMQDVVMWSEVLCLGREPHLDAEKAAQLGVQHSALAQSVSVPGDCLGVSKMHLTIFWSSESKRFRAWVHGRNGILSQGVPIDREHTVELPADQVSAIQLGKAPGSKAFQFFFCPAVADSKIPRPVAPASAPWVAEVSRLIQETKEIKVEVAAALLPTRRPDLWRGVHDLRAVLRRTAQQAPLQFDAEQDIIRLVS